MNKPARHRLRIGLLWFSALHLMLQVVLAIWPVELGELHWSLTCLLYLPPLALIGGSLALVAVSGYLRAAAPAAVGLLATLVALLFHTGLGLGQSRGAPELPSLKVVSWNIKGGWPFRANIPYLRSLDADIILFQECRNRRAIWTTEALQDYHTVFGVDKHVAILSRLPILESRAVEGLDRAIEAHISTELGVLRVFSVHVRKGQRTQGTPPPLRETYQNHRRVRKLLNESIRGSGVIIAGDFNAPPQSPLVKGLPLRDAFSEAGLGVGLTYPARYPLWRLDHILLSEDLVCRQISVLNSDLSDHRPVLARLALRQD